MEKLKRNLKDDSGRVTAFLPGYLFGYGVGMLFGISIAHDGHHTEDYVKQTQHYNQQLETQLSEITQPVNNLVLDDNDQFQFETVTKDGTAERCSGEYAVKQAKALISGNLTCTQVVVVGGQEAN
ncbi:MAG TPA: hypothetical protein VHB51_02025 [Candidatus Saccharimonadales bacterium]|nr:hypothetical protein [Candidatus Saccharimonadales bacterium]